MRKWEEKRMRREEEIQRRAEKAVKLAQEKRRQREEEKARLREVRWVKQRSEGESGRWWNDVKVDRNLVEAELFGRWSGGTHATLQEEKKRREEEMRRYEESRMRRPDLLWRASRVQALVIWHIFMNTFSVFTAYNSDLIYIYAMLDYCKIIGSQSPMIQDERLTKHHEYKKSLVRSCKSEVWMSNNFYAKIC